MSRFATVFLLILIPLQAFSCPTLDLSKTFAVEGSLNFSFQGPEGYELRSSEIGDALMSVNLRPEGTSSMDIATGRVQVQSLQF